jgi:4-amino-4-deoxy-L-arabinose transferase-like glycosyltransferase
MEKKNKLINILSDDRLLYLVLGGIILLVLSNSLYGRFSRDELEAIHSSWKILNGEIVYVDFFQHHHPFLYYTLAPLLKVFGESASTLVFFRVIIFVLYILILWVTYNIALLLFDSKKTGLLSLILLSCITNFFVRAIEVRPDVPQVFWGLVAIYFFILQHKRKSAKYTLLGAFSLGISFLFLQKALFIMIAILLLQLVRLYTRRTTFTTIYVYWCCFILSLLPYLYYIFHNGFMSDYVLYNWIININFLDSFSPIRGLVRSYKQNPVVWTFFALGVLFSRRYIVKEVCALSFILLLAVFLVKAPYEQYYMMFFPLMAIIAGHGLVCTINNKIAINSIASFAVAPVAMIIFCDNLVMTKNTHQLEKIEYVISNTNRNDYVYDGYIKFNVFRKDIDFFWYSIHPNAGLETYQSLYPYDYDIYELIDRFKPKIISNYYIDNMNHEIIKKQYHPSDEYEDIFVRKGSPIEKESHW